MLHVKQCIKKDGADKQDRTAGLRFTRASLYQLSYVGYQEGIALDFLKINNVLFSWLV